MEYKEIFEFIINCYHFLRLVVGIFLLLAFHSLTKIHFWANTKLMSQFKIWRENQLSEIKGLMSIYFYIYILLWKIDRACFLSEKKRKISNSTDIEAMCTYAQIFHKVQIIEVNCKYIHNYKKEKIFIIIFYCKINFNKRYLFLVFFMYNS